VANNTGSDGSVSSRSVPFAEAVAVPEPAPEAIAPAPVAEDDSALHYEIGHPHDQIRKLKDQLQAARDEIEHLRASPARQVRLEAAAEMVLPQDIAGCYAVIGSLMQERAEGGER
jgi:hypothetical protein